MIYLTGNWMDTGSRANDTYFLVEQVFTDKAEALASQWDTVFAAESGSEMNDWDDITDERNGADSPASGFRYTGLL